MHAAPFFCQILKSWNKVQALKLTDLLSFSVHSIFYPVMQKIHELYRTFLELSELRLFPATWSRKCFFLWAKLAAGWILVKCRCGLGGTQSRESVTEEVLLLLILKSICSAELKGSVLHCNMKQLFLETIDQMSIAIATNKESQSCCQALLNCAPQRWDFKRLVCFQASLKNTKKQAELRWGLRHATARVRALICKYLLTTENG